MPSDRQKTTGYPLPEVIQPYPLIDVCLKIPDAPEYRAAFYGAVYALSKWYSWEKTWSHGDTRGTQAAEYWRQILVQYLMIGEDCNAMAFQLRQNPTNTCQMQQSTDGGVTWSLAFDFSLCQPTAPILYNINNQITQNTLNQIFNRYDGSNVQTININAPADYYNGDGGAARSMALCMACKAYIASQAAEYASYARLVLGVAGVFAVVGGFIPVIGTIAIELTAAMLAAVSIGVLEALTDANALEQVTCCMRDGLQGQAVTYANWTGSLNSCGFDSGSHAEFIRVSIAQSFDSQKNWTSFINTLGDAYIAAQAGVEDCPECCDVDPHIWDWKNNNPTTLSGWTLLTTTIIPIIGNTHFDPVPVSSGFGYTATLVNVAGGWYINGGQYQSAPMVGMYYDTSPDEQLCACTLHLNINIGGGFCIAIIYADTGSGLEWVANSEPETANPSDAYFSLGVGVQRIAVIINSDYTASPQVYLGHIDLTFT